jgi:hypothetical protein
MASSSVRIASKFMMAMGFYTLVVSLFWIFLTDVFFVSDFGAYTGQSLSDALASGSKPAELWLIAKRLIGVELLPISVLILLITQKSYSKGEKWSWFALLIAGLMTWGSLIGYKVAIGYFQPTPSSMTFIIGAILFVIGIVLPAKTILSTESS